MDFETLKLCCAISEDITPKPYKGVCLCFHGLNGTGFCGWYEQERWAKLGYLLVQPYYGPWSWMNRETRLFVDEVVDTVYRCYELDESLPLLSTGGSMGGYSAFLYARYALRHPIAGVVSYYPATDLKYHFTEREDVAKTVLNAFRSYHEDREKLFIEHSPIKQIDNLPRIPYVMVHSDVDKAVDKTVHADPMAREMKEKGFDITYYEMQGYEHCQMLPEEIQAEIEEFVKQFIS